MARDHNKLHRSSIIAAVIGGFSSTVASLDALAAEKKEKEIRIRSFLKRHRIPSSLQSQIVHYYDYVWQSGQETADQIFEGLPPLLMSQLQVNLKRRLVDSVDMFKDCSTISVIALVRRLSTILVIPDEIVMKRGDVGNSMFFVRNGSLSAFREVADEVEVTKQYIEGDHFGEYSFFAQDGIREVSVRADTHCSLEELSFLNLADLVRMYDDIAAQVHSRFAAQHEVSLDAEGLQELAKDVRAAVDSDDPGTPHTPSTRRLAATNSGRGSVRRLSRKQSRVSEPGSARRESKSRKQSRVSEPNSGKRRESKGRKTSQFSGVDDGSGKKLLSTRRTAKVQPSKQDGDGGREGSNMV